MTVLIFRLCSSCARSMPDRTGILMSHRDDVRVVAQDEIKRGLSVIGLGNDAETDLVPRKTVTERISRFKFVIHDQQFVHPGFSRMKVIRVHII